MNLDSHKNLLPVRQSMNVVAFTTEHVVMDRIIRHLELTLVAEKPPPSHVFEQVALMAAEESGDYE